MKRSSTENESDRPDWNEVFSKSSLGAEVYFVRGTFSLYKNNYDHEAWSRIRNTLDELGVPPVLRQDSELSAVIARDRTYTFLDGVFTSSEGNYLFERKGAWVWGRKAFRYLCYELGLRQRRRFPGELSIPSHADLETELRHQLKERLERLNNLYHLDSHPKYEFVQRSDED